MKNIGGCRVRVSLAAMNLEENRRNPKNQYLKRRKMKKEMKKKKIVKGMNSRFCVMNEP